MWKKIYYIALILRFYWVFLPLTGYIHPDEFFQGPEKVAGDLFNYDIHTAWEFDESFPIRSASIWYLLCGYPFWFMRILRSTGAIHNLDSYWLIVTPRFMMAVLSFLTDNATMKTAELFGCSPYMAGCLSATSYVTIVFYTRSFSNSVEACIFAFVLMLVCDYVLLCKPRPSSSSVTDPQAKSTRNITHSHTSQANGVSETSSNASIAESSSNMPADDKFDAANSSQTTHEKSSIKKTKMGQLMEKYTHITDSDSAHSVHKEVPAQKQPLKDPVDNYQHQRNKISIIITVLIVVGVWNRPTFIGYALVPSLYWLFQGKRPRSIRDILMAMMRGLFNIPYVINTSLIFILFDTSYYRSKRPLTENILNQFVITPLNFVIYNQNSENLAQHGIHPRYLHALVNAPLLLGPLVAFIIIFLYMALYIANKDYRSVLTMIFLSLITPLGLLSVFPHQEPRFIIPLLVPAIIIASYGLKLIQSKTLYVAFFLFWIPHNFIFGILFGVIHQGGVVPSLLHLQRQKSAGVFNGGATLIYHRTYMPPKSLLQLHKHESKHLRLIDLQGKVDDARLADELVQYDTFRLITPYDEDRINGILQDKFSIDPQASFYPHFSMEDPPDFDNLFAYDDDGFADWDATLKAFERHLTLNIYKITNKKIIVQTFPSSGDCTNLKDNIEQGAYDTMAITLPKPQVLSM